MHIDDLPRFDAADYLKTPEDVVEFLNAALEEGDPADIRRALRTIARAKGMTAVAESAGLGRTSLHKALGEKGNPEFSSILKVMDALGLSLSARQKAA